MSATSPCSRGPRPPGRHLATSRPIQSRGGMGLCNPQADYGHPPSLDLLLAPAAFSRWSNGGKPSSWTRRPAVPNGKVFFRSLVLEAVGGAWSGARRAVVAWLASEAKRSSVPVPRNASLSIARRISCTFHKENARAIGIATRKSWSSRPFRDGGVVSVSISSCVLSWPGAGSCGPSLPVP